MVSASSTRKKTDELAIQLKVFNLEKLFLREVSKRISDFYFKAVIMGYFVESEKSV